MTRPPAITISDVAAAADVSRTTVSHVLSQKRPVAEETRHRVLRAIEELGYRPNGIARSLRTQRSHTVALVIPDITNPFYPVLARGLQDGLASDYRVFVCNTDARGAVEREMVEDVVQRGVDGVVLVAFEVKAAQLEHVVRRGAPLVSIGRMFDHPDVDVVESDDQEGARAATQHLLTLGHDRIGFVAGTARTGELRRAGYESALADAGRRVEPGLVAQGDWTREGGLAATRRLLGAGARPTALFCANDLMAIGALDAAREQGLDVPGDLSVVGFDDVDAAGLVTPGLTTVSNPAYQLGRSAGELLTERMASGSAVRRRDLTLSCPLVIRASTARRS